MLNFVHGLADEAGVIARRYWRAPLTVQAKADQSPVTIADQEIEQMLRAMIEREYPEHGIFGEEYGKSRPDAAYQWVLDPIDGTRSFIAGQTTFCTLIALCHHGKPILGVIDQPITRERWLGADGRTEYRSASGIKILSLDAAPELTKATISTTSTDYFSAAQAKAFEALSEQAGQTLRGGDAYAYGSLTLGKIHMVIDAGMKPYDYAALVPVVEGALGVITDWHGQALTLESDGSVLAALTPALHAEALVYLRL